MIDLKKQSEVFQKLAKDKLKDKLFFRDLVNIREGRGVITIKTEVLGLACTVEGELYEEGFEIHSIKHFRCDLDMEGIKDEVLEHVASEALRQTGRAAIEAGIEAEIDQYNRGMCNDNG